MKFLHRHLPIFANLVKNAHKVLRDMQILNVSEKQGHRNMSISSYGHNIYSSSLYKWNFNQWRNMGKNRSSEEILVDVMHS
jgi:hypothetical protein